MELKDIERSIIKGYKKKIKDMQSKFNEAGQSRFDIYCTDQRIIA